MTFQNLSKISTSLEYNSWIIDFVKLTEFVEFCKLNKDSNRSRKTPVVGCETSIFGVKNFQSFFTNASLTVRKKLKLRGGKKLWTESSRSSEPISLFQLATTIM